MSAAASPWVGNLSQPSCPGGWVRPPLGHPVSDVIFNFFLLSCTAFHTFQICCCGVNSLFWPHGLTYQMSSVCVCSTVCWKMPGMSFHWRGLFKHLDMMKNIGTAVWHKSWFSLKAVWFVGGSSEIEIVDELFSILDCVSLLASREVILLTFLSYSAPPFLVSSLKI